MAYQQQQGPPRINISAPHSRETSASGGTMVDRQDTLPYLYQSHDDPEAESLDRRYQRALEEQEQHREAAGINEKSSKAARFDSNEPPRTYEPKVEAYDTDEDGRGGGGDYSDDSDATSFDWDGDSDFGSDDGEHRHSVAAAADEADRNQMKRARRLRYVYLGCMRLSRPVRLILLAFIGTGIFLTPAIVCYARFPGNGKQSHVKLWSLWAGISWAAACATSLAVDKVPDLVRKLVLAFFGVALESTKTYMEIFMEVATWLKFTLDITWSWIIMAAMRSQFGGQTDMGYLRYVLQAQAALFGTSIVLLVEKSLLNLVAVNFHKTSLKDRLEENSLALRALDKLSSAKVAAPKQPRSRGGWTPAFVASARSSRPHSRANSTEDLRTFAAKAQGTGSPDVSIPMGSPGGGTATDGHKKSRSTGGSGGSPAFRSTGARTPKTSGVAAKGLADALSDALLKDRKGAAAKDVASTHSARMLARKLFEGLGGQRDTLVVADFFPYFKSEEEAQLSFGLFDKDGNGDISRREMREAVQRIYRERKALSTGLKDMSSAVSKLDGIMLVLAFIIALFIWLLIFNRSSTVSNLVPLSTVVLGFSFIFGNSAKNVFESMVFIFSVHPYDVGDLVFIDDQPLVVREFGLVSTVFNRVDNFIIIAPNSLLATTKLIHNVRRSGSMWETTNIQIGFETSLEVMHELRARMRHYVAERNRDWKGGLEINIDSMTNQNYITLTVAMEHKSNFQDWGGRWNRRTKLMRHLKTTLDDLAVTYTLPVQPVTFQPHRPSGQIPRSASNNSSSSNPLHPRRSSGRHGSTASQQRPSAATGNAGQTQMGTGLSATSDASRQGLRVDVPQSFNTRRSRNQGESGGFDGAGA